jgi:hypothetical protein
MNVYKVETQSEATCGWEAIATIRPDYEAATLFEGWFIKRRLIVILNPDAAELAAELRAVALGKRLRGQRRIKRTTEIDGEKCETVIWENGRWLESVGILKRIKAWSV